MKYMFIFSRYIIYGLMLCYLVGCTTVEKRKFIYKGEQPIYTAVAYVMNLNSARLVKADILNNDYITSYIIYSMFGRINRFRLYMTLVNNVFETEVGDVQIRIGRGGFESWESVDASSLIDSKMYTQKVSIDIIRAAGSALYANFKDTLQRDLEFNRIVLKDLPVSKRQLWVSENMKPHNFPFDSKIERILKTKKNKKYGKYLVKMSSHEADLKSHIKLEFYSNNPAYTRYQVGDSLSVTGRLVEASYANRENVLTILLQDSF